MDAVREAYRRLLRRFGQQHWWPARSPFEVIVGAILMPQTSWTRVEVAIENLRRAGLLTPDAIGAAPVRRLRDLVRVAGFHRTKPRRLKVLCSFLVARGQGGIDGWLGTTATPDLRRELLALDGVGPETADSVLLYAASRPVFVVDSYTRRIGRRLGWFETDDYDEVQRFFEERLPRDASLFNEYHALLVRHGKELCRPRPLCSQCPLNSMCAYYRRTSHLSASNEGRDAGSSRPLPHGREPADEARGRPLAGPPLRSGTVKPHQAAC